VSKDVSYSAERVWGSQKSVTQGASGAKFGRYFFYRVVPPRPSLTHKKEAPPWGRA